MIVWMCIWIAQNVRQSDALPSSPKEFQKYDLLSKNPALPANIEFELETILSIHAGRFSAKLRLLHQAVTGSLYCIILNYVAQLCYYKDAIGTNSQASQ